ncbi:uncharacterized protein UTRI_02408 [Ustilago trichophora]|uniref:Uncharacterized protein n=1 Tax=Ustilago trichophora TaxID=86804 RepID=A0A5C3E6I5_9BASI|nr:uncharacterized protein UTRI_02408 [Ustilago trichophora]
MARHQKVAKRLSRGDDPATIKAICFGCCNGPVDGPTIDSPAITRPLPPPPPPPPPQQQQHAPKMQPDQLRRGRCIECRIDYPLVRKFFTKYDIRLDGEDRRICYSCRTKQGTDEAIEDAVANGFDVDVDGGDGSLQEAHTLAQDRTIQNTLLAAEDFANLNTKTILAMQLAERRRRLRFVPSRELIRQHHLRLADQQIAQLSFAVLNQHDLAKRNASFGKAFDYSTDTVPDHPDAYEILKLVGGLDEDITAYDFDAPNLGDAPSNPDGDDEGDGDGEDDAYNGPAVWHLTERERLDRLRRARQTEYDPLLGPQQPFRSEDVQKAAMDEDLLKRFQQCVAISIENPSPPIQPAPTSFAMTYLLNSLETQTRAMAASARSVTAHRSSAQPAKRVRSNS